MMTDGQNSIWQPSTLDEIKTRMLVELQNSMGDLAEELMPELAPMLLEDVPTTLANIRQAIMAQDAQQVEKLAHTLKGSCGSMGIMALAAHCQEIENMGRNGRLDDALTRLSYAETEYEQVKQLLEQYV